MPEISRVLGIVIAMYYNDHAPPHFHAKYGAFEITGRIADGVVEVSVSRRSPPARNFDSRGILA